MAAEYTWSGLDGTWSTPGSWIGNTTPATDGTAELIFGGTGATGYTASNDLDDPFELHRLTFNSSALGPVVLASGALQFQSLGEVGPVLEQLGSGEVTIGTALMATNRLTLTGDGEGVVTISGKIGGNGGLQFTGGNWRIINSGNNYTGGTVIGLGAYVELVSGGTGSQNLSIAGSGASFLGDTSNHGANSLLIDGGTLKLTTRGGGELMTGMARPVTFGANGGVLDLRNFNDVDPLAAGGNISASGNLAITTTAGTGTAVIQFNGGQFGLARNHPEQGEWLTEGNNLRFSSLSGTGALRVELTNGAQLRTGDGSTQLASSTIIPMPLTIRGVDGGDPTSGEDGLLNTAVTRDVGRVLLSNNIVPTQGITFEGAVQVHNGNAALAINGAITIAGDASGHAGHVSFSGRTTGTQLGPTLLAPGLSAVGQNVLWLGLDFDDRMTIESGGIAVVDSRIRFDQPLNHGVALNAATEIAAGGKLRFLQSLSNLSPTTGSSQNSLTANVGNHIIQGNIIGRGTSEQESVVDLLLPPANLLLPSPAPNSIPYGGIEFQPTSKLVVHGSGFGGLQINARPRPATLFGGAEDTFSTATKLDSMLTTERLSGMTGSGGYLSAAAVNEIWFFPFEGEWAVGAPVGLRVLDSNANGEDVSLAAANTFSHSISVDAGATLSLGAASVEFGVPTASKHATLSGNGTVTGINPLKVLPGGTISPGQGSIGQLTLPALDFNGKLVIETTAAGTADKVSIDGDLVLGPKSMLRFPEGNTYQQESYTIATYTGSLTGTFAGVENAPIDYVLSYGSGTDDSITLVYSPAATRTWNGNDSRWDVTTANWKEGLTYVNDSDVRFDDTALGTHNILLMEPVAPRRITVENTSNYDFLTNGDGAITGRTQLVKRGIGTLSLTGTHTYTGGTVIEEGGLSLSSGGALPTAGSVTIKEPGSLGILGAGTTVTVGDVHVEGLVGAGTLSVGNFTVADTATLLPDIILNGTLTKIGSGQLEIPGAIDLGGGVRIVDVPSNGASLRVGALSNGGIGKIGLGTLVFNAIATYLGPTHVNAGTLMAGGPDYLPAASLFTVVDGATLDLNNYSQVIGGLTGSGRVHLRNALLTLNQDSDTQFVGEILGTGSLIKAGTGTIEILPPQSFSGGLIVNGGMVRLMATGAGGTGGVTVNAGGTFHTSAPQSMLITLAGGTLSTGIQSSLIEYTSGGLQVTANSTVRLFDSANAFTNGEVLISGPLSGSGNIEIQAGPGAVGAGQGPAFRLRNTTTPSTYSGKITIRQGAKLELRSNGAFSSGGTADLELEAGAHFGGGEGTYSQLSLRASDSANYGHDIVVAGTGVVNFDIGAIPPAPASIVHGFGDLQIGGGQRVIMNGGNPTHTLAFATVTLTGGTAEFAPVDPLFGRNGIGETGGMLSLGDINEATEGSGIRMNGNGIVTLAGTAAHTGQTVVDSGTVIVSGNISASSGVEVRGGELRVDGIIGATTPISVLEGLLSGTGQMDGTVHLGDGTGPTQSSRMSPGGTALGQLQFGSLTLGGTDAVWEIQINSNTLENDFLHVDGALSLGDGFAHLDLSDLGNTALLPPGETFLIARAEGGVTGYFAGLPDDTYFSINGRSFRISYDENDGRDIVLIPEPGAAALIFASMAVALCGRRRRLAA